MIQNPLVTVVIPTRNRGPELEKTLAALKQQKYRPLEVIVIDDASDEPLEPLIRGIWPDARYWRKESNVGQCQCRNEAFRVARGEYVLSLDDDASFTRRDDLERAVARMQCGDGIGALTFYTFHGAEMPADLSVPDYGERLTQSFLGAAALLRRSVIDRTGGFFEAFGGEGEEEELSIRILDADSGILFLPEIIVHHRISPLSRSNARTWERGLRNKLWLIVLHIPWKRIPVEAAWKIAGASWDAMRLGRPVRFFRALWQCAAGLHKVLAHRHAISDLTLRRYDAIRFRGMCTAEEYANPVPCGIGDLWNWLRGSWWHRRRLRSGWSDRSEGVGRVSTGEFLANGVPRTERSQASVNAPVN